MVSEPILARFLGHPLSGCYRTILKQYSLTSTRDEVFQ